MSRHPYADFIDQVAKPARYLGGEYLSARKPADQVEARVVLAFPDVYEIGMSHLGSKILYAALNCEPRIAAERAFAPWGDMEALLRQHQLPLLSLESSTPLSHFDVVGISLQYELTFTNVLTLLDLGGLPLHAADRGAGDPLVLGGGPTATHPEPMAPFFDAFFIGEAEERLPALVLAWKRLVGQGLARGEALASLAAEFPIYVPSLYDTAIDPATGMTVVGAPLDARVPARVTRATIPDLDDFPFPTATPVPYAEAVFDRAAIEIARGCTEGCRFCQAGMIYRPARERSPGSIVDSVVEGVTRAGYDEISLTSLSTADYSCIGPLVGQVMTELEDRKVSLSVSSLRAYGLSEEILDQLSTLRVTGLTFAPEAGSQRLRDVINKNITDAHIEESAARLFARNWSRLKLYFMIGLPTEREEDLAGIVDLARRVLSLGRARHRGRAEVTVSVSSHVPKPHTPFQWCSQDSSEQIQSKQHLLRDQLRGRGLRFKAHDYRTSYLEGILARGDRRLAAAIELAWQRGARFDGWDEMLDADRWTTALTECGLDPASYLGARPAEARLPWDHIDVGVERDFLVKQYQRALAGRSSPPCAKRADHLVHPATVAEAEADHGKLVCYDCGIGCDLDAVRERRLAGLRSLSRTVANLDEAGSDSAELRSASGAAGLVTPPELAQLRGLSSAPLCESSGTATDSDSGSDSDSDSQSPKKRWVRPRPPGDLGPMIPNTVYRLRYTKLGRAAFLGHLDTVRMIARSLRRARVEVAYSRGFHPKPVMRFGPALALGVTALGELCDVAIEGSIGPDELLDRLRQVSPEGNEFEAVWQLPPGSPGLTKLITAYELAIQPADPGRPCDAARLDAIATGFLARSRVELERKGKPVDIRAWVDAVAVVDAEDAGPLRARLGWDDGCRRGAALLVARVLSSSSGSAKPREVAEALGVWGDGPAHALLARLGFQGLDGHPGGGSPATP